MNQPWWQLHLRVARGEALSAEERAAYEVGLRQLENDEQHPAYVAQLAEARSAVVVLEAEHQALHARRAQLDAEIAALEKALSQQTRQALGV